MPTYRRLPLPVDAVQLSWRTWGEVADFLGPAFLAENPQGATAIPASEASDTCGEDRSEYICLKVRTASGETILVRHGDYILREEIPGRFYPCDPATFMNRHEPDTEDSCTTVTIDGEDIRVHGRGDLTENGREALGALLEVARRKLHEEADHDGSEKTQAFNTTAAHMNFTGGSVTNLMLPKCPLCGEMVTVLAAPELARAHFQEAHPEWKLTGSGPWPLLEVPEVHCAHCGDGHDWNDCEAYAQLVRDEHNAALVRRIDSATRDVLNGALATFLDLNEPQANSLHHVLVSAMSAEVYRKVPTG